jgi:hypothetical protein
MLPYRYRSLEHEDSIRILVLYPNQNDSDPLECTLEHARLSDTFLRYEAVSYTWGDAIDQQTIYLDGGKTVLCVMKNCHSTLQQLRHKQLDRLLWLDAICIDQNNLKERTCQVRIMDRIYKSAFGVTAYMGEESASSRILFEQLEKWDRQLKGEEEEEDYYSDLPVESKFRELEALFKRPWFKRVWVLQEVCKKKHHVTFMCGPASATSTAIMECFLGYPSYRVHKRIWPLAIKLIYGGPDTFPTPQFNLWQMLFKSRACLATDPRDRVFALKSLIGPSQSDMDYLIDYDKSVEMIYIETALFLWPVLGLRILTAIRHPHERDMPSWIPDWSQNLPLDYDFYQKNPEQYVPLYVPTLKFLDEGIHVTHMTVNGENNRHLELLAKGCRYAQIVHRSQVFSFSSLEDAEAQMKELYLNLGNLRKFLDPDDMEDNRIVHDRLGQKLRDGTCTGNTLCAEF